jgi:hypothetical protein
LAAQRSTVASCHYKLESPLEKLLDAKIPIDMRGHLATDILIKIPEEYAHEFERATGRNSEMHQRLHQARIRPALRRDRRSCRASRGQSGDVSSQDAGKKGIFAPSAEGPAQVHHADRSRESSMNLDPHISLIGDLYGRPIVHIDGKEIAKRSKDGKRWISRRSMPWSVRDGADGSIEVERLADNRVWRFKAAA